MPTTDALAYPRKVTYNFSQWGEEPPVSVSLDGATYFGVLKSHSAPYRVALTEVFEEGASRRIPPRTLELDTLDGVHFLHQHSH